MHENVNRTPEILLEKYVGSPFAFQRVAFPTVTEECLQYRNKELSGSRCSDDPLKRIGEKIGSCDYAAVPVKKVMSAGLRTSVYSVPEARRSPAFDFLKQIYMPQYSLTNILRHFDPNQPREAVCEWVYDNLETLLRYAPTGYPKDVLIFEHHALTYSAYVFAGIALVCTITTSAFTYKWRENRILKVTQLDVLACILCGKSRIFMSYLQIRLDHFSLMNYMYLYLLFEKDMAYWHWHLSLAQVSRVTSRVPPHSG